MANPLHTCDGNCDTDMCDGHCSDQPEEQLAPDNYLGRIAKALERIVPALEDVSIMGVRRTDDDQTSQLAEQIGKLQDQQEKLQDWMSEHGQHDSSCTFWHPGNNKPDNRYNQAVCSCGFAKLLETQKLKS